MRLLAPSRRVVNHEEGVGLVASRSSAGTGFRRGRPRRGWRWSGAPRAWSPRWPVAVLRPLVGHVHLVAGEEVGIVDPELGDPPHHHAVEVTAVGVVDLVQERAPLDDLLLRGYAHRARRSACTFVMMSTALGVLARLDAEAERSGLLRRPRRSRRRRDRPAPACASSCRAPWGLYARSRPASASYCQKIGGTVEFAGFPYPKRIPSMIACRSIAMVSARRTRTSSKGQVGRFQGIATKARSSKLSSRAVPEDSMAPHRPASERCSSPACRSAARSGASSPRVRRGAGSGRGTACHRAPGKRSFTSKTSSAPGEAGHRTGTARSPAASRW